jgi:hypothetical protein
MQKIERFSGSSPAVLSEAIIHVTVEYMAELLVVPGGVVMGIVSEVVSALPVGLSLLHIFGKAPCIRILWCIHVLATTHSVQSPQSGNKPADFTPLPIAVKFIELAGDCVAESTHESISVAARGKGARKILPQEGHTMFLEISC